MLDTYVFAYNIFHAFLLLIIIMGPFTGLPVFLKITQEFDRRKKIKAANRAITFAFFLLIFFTLLGMELLNFFGISFEGFRIAGGIILLLLGIEYMFHVNFSDKRSEHYSTDIVVPFAMPLIIGPGVITNVILLTGPPSLGGVGYIPTLIGGIIALLIYWLFLYFADNISRRIGAQGIEIIARFMGLLLMAIAIDMMKGGVVGFIKAGLGM